MTIPVWVLLAFAVWTLLVLISTSAVYRWSRLLTGRATPASYAKYADYKSESEDW